MGDDLLGIGQFARLSGLTVKALRYYDRVGLLRPAVVEASSGFRRYERGQLAQARTVSLLRSLDVPLDEVRTCLTGDGAAAGDAVLRAHLRRLESRVTRLTRNIHRLHHLLDDEGDRPMATDKQAPDVLDPETERSVAVQLFNGTWELMGNDDRSPEEDDEMIHMAHASRHHWGRIGKPENLARGEWQCSRVYAVLGRAEPCRWHAQRVLDICQSHGIGDFDLAFAYEALARAAAVAGDTEEAQAMAEKAFSAGEAIADPEDRQILLGDLETIPGIVRSW